MKALTRYTYGGPDVLQFEEIGKPSVKEGHILVRVIANSVNPADWRILRGKPIFARLTYGLFRPKSNLVGSDFSGVVEAVGKSVTIFKAGDRVFGSTLKGGAFAEYITIHENACWIIPDNSNFIEMGALPMAGITAYQALISDGQLKKGETVLINGAAGGVGHIAVQIAKYYGAKVTAVCSSHNADFMKVLGAENVIAYDKVDIHKHGEKYDLILDVHGNLTYKDYRRMGQRGVLVGFTTMMNMLSVLLKAGIGSVPVKLASAKANTKDLKALSSLVDSKNLRVHIEKTHSYQQIPEALSDLERMKTRGKVVIVWDTKRQPDASSL